MKTYLCGAFALAAAGTLANAGTASESTWLGLDEELHSLSSSVSLADHHGIEMGAVIRSNFTHSTDIPANAQGDDISGFFLQNARLWLAGTLGDFSWRLSGDFGDEVGLVDAVAIADDPTFGLLDAYASWAVGDMFTVTWGRFMAPLLLSNSTGPENLLFVNRSNLGLAFYNWDQGVMLSGDYDQLRWHAGMQNGESGVADEYFIFARAEYDLGAGARGHEGAYGAHRNEDLNATIGVFVADEGAVDDGMAFGADARMTMGAFSGGFEIVSFDDNSPGFQDSTPWAVNLGYMVVPDEWELGVRWEDLDDAAGTTVLTAGANWYLNGHNTKWQFNVLRFDDDNDDGLAFQVGLTIGLNS
jgi:hypothetical protein